MRRCDHEVAQEVVLLNLLLRFVEDVVDEAVDLLLAPGVIALVQRD